MKGLHQIKITIYIYIYLFISLSIYLSLYLSLNISFISPYLFITLSSLSIYLPLLFLSLSLSQLLLSFSLSIPTSLLYLSHYLHIIFSPPSFSLSPSTTTDNLNKPTYYYTYNYNECFMSLDIYYIFPHYKLHNMCIHRFIKPICISSSVRL